MSIEYYIFITFSHPRFYIEPQSFDFSNGKPANQFQFQSMWDNLTRKKNYVRWIIGSW